MSDCFITVNTHPTLSPVFVIENSTANISNCVFNGDPNPWEMNMQDILNLVNSYPMEKVSMCETYHDYFTEVLK